jgi:hypothetical protein
MNPTMTANPLVLIQAIAVEHDADGYWSRPSIPNGDNDLESQIAFHVSLTQQGLTYHISGLEREDDTHPVYQAYYEEECCVVVGWNPEPPAGDDWFTHLFTIPKMVRCGYGFAD